MKTRRTIPIVATSMIFATGISSFWADGVSAHCDTTSGPIISEAKSALDKGDVTPLLKWIRKDDEAEIKAAFTKTIVVRAKGSAAKELADQYFLETLVRVHRTGEGASYTGIKDTPVEPIVAMADKALAKGSADEMIKTLNSHMAEAIKKKLNKALAAKKNKDGNVEAGREFVECYVTYTHYVEGIHSAIESNGDRHTEARGDAAAHKD